jgi:hypothetical protein
LKFLHTDCDITLADDRTLPYTAYLVTYKVEEVLKYDVVVTDKTCDIFDHYWDKYREGFVSYKQSEGRVNPRLWNSHPREQPKEKKRR